MGNAPLVLSLETATLGGSIWLGRGEIELAARNGDPLVSQSNSLLSDINDCLKESGVSLADVELFACAAGPGSFTGLRIGIATLKALAATLNRSCAGIPTLHAVARSAGPSKTTVAVMPAGRGEVFTQMFSVSSVSGNEFVEPLDTAAHLSPQKLIERYGLLPQIKWAGSGAHLQSEIIERAASARGIVFGERTSADSAAAHGVPNWQLVNEEKDLAKHVAALALQAYHGGRRPRPEELQAIYVRPSDAELAK